MKKTWVKKENIYYKPFYKHKSKMLLLGIFLLGIVFFIYQVLSINQLPISSTPFSLDNTLEFKDSKYIIVLNPGNAVEQQHSELSSTEKNSSEPIKIIRGIRLFDYDAYKPNFEGKFQCLDGSKAIPFVQVNDEFCDCITDGSDEPSTNACEVGKFYCKYQKRHITGRGRDVYIPSSRVNDGICDCCDGSDEWTTVECPNRCS
ncbi:uncharacterized protein LOC129953734 isoform X1 [Eupeodes corollae]|uniref:uncharacterized protein LOC129953734 isoform X1 n=1 Tax=Eupeodes corollae TaxID=290404 RepID=UPI002490A13A|nr:uncharacterized protein LOC129953734 isoform X1 [Eupeodes corollae]